MWQVMTDYNAAKKFAVFLVNDENQEVPITQTPFINVRARSVDRGSCYFVGH